MTTKITTVYWDDPRPCSSNALRLMKLLYPDVTDVVACIETSYEEAQEEHGPGPRVDAEMLAGRVGHSIEAVLSDDEDQILPS